MNSRTWDNTGKGFSIGLIPPAVIFLFAVGWLLVGIVWIITLIINVITIAMGGWVFVIIEGLWLLADWINSWLGDVIIGYFTRAHFFNWLNNIFLIAFTTIGGIVLDILGVDLTSDNETGSSTKSRKGGQNTIPVAHKQDRRATRSSRSDQSFSSILSSTADRTQQTGEIPQLDWVSLGAIVSRIIGQQVPGIPVPSDRLDDFDMALSDMKFSGKLKTRWHDMERNIHDDSSANILPSNVSLMHLPLAGSFIELTDMDLWFSILAAEGQQMSMPHVEKFEQGRFMSMGSVLHMFVLSNFAYKGIPASKLQPHHIQEALKIGQDFIDDPTRFSFTLHIFGDQIVKNIKDNWKKQKQQSRKRRQQFGLGL